MCTSIWYDHCAMPLSTTFFVRKFASGLQRQYTKIGVSSGEIPLSNITLLHFSVSVVTQFSVHKCIDFQVSSFMHSEKSDSCGVTISNRKRREFRWFFFYKIEHYITSQINKKSLNKVNWVNCFQCIFIMLIYALESWSIFVFFALFTSVCIWRATDILF